MKKNHNFQFGGNNNNPSDTPILPIEVSNSKVFTKYKLATLFMVFALFFYFIDFNRAEATTDCDGCTNGTWVASTDLEKISVNYAGCNAIFSYEKKVCTLPPPTKYELRITGFELSPGCTSPDVENLMKEANKKLLWSARSIFGVTGTSINVRLYTRSCWYVNTAANPDRLEPCSNIEDCCQTLYALSTVEDGKGMKINNSTQTNANDSTCVGAVGGGCGEYICESQNLPTNVPLWEIDNTICGSECDEPWNADARDFVDTTNATGCDYRAYYAMRSCGGVTYFTITQLSYSGTCSPIPSYGTILGAISTTLFTKFSTLIALPGYATILLPQCWQNINNAYLPCSTDECCSREYFFRNSSDPKRASAPPLSTVYNPYEIDCSLNTNGCDKRICDWLKTANSIIFNKISIENTEVTNEVLIQPIPITDEFNIQLNSSVSDIISIIVSDIIGNELITSELKVIVGNNSFKINSKELKSNSIYFYTIINSNNEVIYNGKLIK